MEGATEVKYRTLDRNDDPLFWPALEFYVESFPREEREPLATVAAVASGDPELCAGNQKRIHFAIAEVDGDMAGIRYFSYHAKARLGFFIYLAVEPRFRRRGIGERLVEFGRAQCLEDARAMGSGLDAIVFECERPELAQSDDEHEFRQKRLDYFTKRGAIMVSRTYVQPSLEEGRDEVPLILMAYPMTGDTDWLSVIERFHRYPLGLEPESSYEVKTKEGVTV